jgi:integrase
MKGRVVNIAAELAVLQQPSAGPAVTADIYTSTLKRHIASSKEKISLALFERWLRKQKPAPDPRRGECLLERFADDLSSGRFAGKRGRYSYMMKQAPSDIYTLHNRAALNKDAEVQRPLITRAAYRHLCRFTRLTADTQAALCWFAEKGVRPAAKTNGSSKPLTAATRRAALYAALQLLDMLKLSGLEQVTPEVLPDPSPDDRDYKTVTRLLHGASTVFRACAAKGLLASDPLANVSHAIFEGCRDFLTPDMMAKLRDLSTVDRKDARQVTDRLVSLLYLDSAVRQKELAGVRMEDVRQVDGGYQIVLRGEVQKMQGKPTVAIDLLYPETNELLGLYLRQVRGGASGSLILNTSGDDARGEWLAQCVQREGRRLELKTYHGKLPSPHALRRTFATCNAKPLGLGMDIAEIAARLRIDIQIANKHYVVQNPLLSEAKARAYRKKASEDPTVVAAECIAQLQKLGFPAATLKPLRLELARMKEALVVKEPPSKEWVEEGEVLDALRQRWGIRLHVRKLRALFRQHGYTDRGLAHGRIRYRRDAVEQMLTAYAPVTPFMGMASKSMFRTSLGAFVTMKIGGAVLLKAGDVTRFVQMLRADRSEDTQAAERALAS